MKIVIGSDHAGFRYKENAKKYFAMTAEHTCIDVGTDSEASTDYPDYAVLAVNALLSRKADMGILICGTGIGMSIAANKFKGIRAAVCESTAAAQLARLHNDANILCIGERLTSWEKALEIIKTFLETSFDDSERHCRRVDKLNKLPQ
jgi:ribose 5-phosphate isomerase B